MATKTLNRPANWKKQVNPNTKRMKQLMRDVRANVERRTRNSQDLDAWMEKLAPYVGANCFSTGIHATDAMDIVNQIVGVVDQTSLPSGSNAEILKGTMAEKCYTMVTNVGEDIRNELRQLAVNGYNERLTPQQLATEMGNKIESLSKTRCQAIARTETCRAANIGNYLNAREMGAKSYSVICNEGCCEYCQEAYGTDETGGVGEVVFDIEDTDSLPPYHPNCRCTPVWSMDPVPGSDDETGDVEDETTEPISNIINTKEALSEINNFHAKYGGSIEEHGAIIDLKNGKQYSPMFHGGKHEVNVPESSENGVSYVKTENCSFIHNHPSTAFRAFSYGDINVTLRSEKINHCLAISEKEVWILKTNPDIPQERMPTTFIVNDFKKASSKIQFEHADFKFGEEARLKKEYNGPELSKRLKEFDEYLKSDDYLDMINERLAKEYSKVTKAYEQYLSLERLSIDEVRNYAK